MPLQNRVDPFGKLQANSSRGLFMGNRGGRFHDPETKTLRDRRWTSKRWIICVCHFKNRKRAVWDVQSDGKASYTELFFLDEVTALSAGHRPCFECRRAAANSYAAAFGRAKNLTGAPGADAMDEHLHAERLAACALTPAMNQRELMRLPDGAMIAIDGKPHAVRMGMALGWSFDGYDMAIPLMRVDSALLLTPPSTVEALRSGYAPTWHPSAEL